MYKQSIDTKETKEEIKKLIEKGNLEKAKLAIYDYLKVVPNDPDIYSMLGVIYFAEKDLNKAEEILLQGTMFDSRNFFLHYNLGYLYYLSKKYTKSFVHYFRALQMCKDKESEEEILKSLTELEKNMNRKEVERLKNVLESINKIIFVQEIPCIRTHKIARMLSKIGVAVELIYIALHPSQVYKLSALPYKNILQINNLPILIDYINKSDCDIVYSSNEPDYYTVVLTLTNKPVIHDTHDMLSLRGGLTNEQIVLEYVANVKSAGNIYTSRFVEELAVKRFGISHKQRFVLENYIEKDLVPHKFKEKLSKKDGEIHCVYEGGLSGNPNSHRYIEEMLLKLANERIHCHLYGNVQKEYITNLLSKSKFIHYEGNLSPKELIYDMTQYDVGLAIMNVEESYFYHVNTASPNKVNDYIAASLPIAFSDFISFRDFNETYKVGKIIDFNKPLYDQILDLKNMKIDRDLLYYQEKLIMNAYDLDLLHFINTCKNNFKHHSDLFEEKDNSYYNQMYSSSNKEYYVKYDKSIYFPVWKKAVEIIKKIDNPRILEIGCGVGQFANYLFDEGFAEYIGIDFSEEAIRKAKDTNIRYKDNFYVDNAYTTDFFNRNYNVLVLFEFLEHVTEDTEILEKIKAGAHVLLSVPNFYSFAHVRWFENVDKVIQRYGAILNILNIYEYKVSNNNIIFLVHGIKK